MPYTEKRKVLNRLAVLKQKQFDLMVELDATMGMARAPDLAGWALCSWAEIAEALGTTKQASWERWGKRA
jgi:hypothetical protein